MIIKKGDSGISVKKIQYKLGLIPDGIFGRDTEHKVKIWQSHMDITSDGIIGEKSWKLLFGCSMSEFSPIGIVIHSMTEKIEWEGEVITAKELLNKLGYSAHALVHPNGRTETLYTTDKKTEHAGKSKHNGLENLNSYFLGVEVLVEGVNNYSEFVRKIQKEETFTDAQIRTTTILTRMWMDEYRIRPRDVVRHSAVAGDDVRGQGKGKVDPGTGFPWKTFKENIS